MLIGVDFDNTIVCYDRVFHRLARRAGLIPAGVRPTKDAVRGFLRRAGREQDWIALQGRAYGPGMALAPAFPGALAFFRRCRRLGLPARVISHRTRRPFAGPAYDLHRSARAWLVRHRLGLRPREARFLLTQQAKLDEVRASGCTHFIDDLPEFLGRPDFPAGVQRLLFAPQGPSPRGPWRRVRSWPELSRLLSPGDGADVELRQGAARLLERMGWRDDFRLEAMPGAANNRVFRILAGPRDFALKAYFHHPRDRRDRLGAEFGFCRYAWGLGLRCLPEPLACDRGLRLGLYGALPGRRPRPGGVGAADVRQALDFYRALNRGRRSAAARALPKASEACFSTAEHLASVEARLARLRRLPARSPLERRARDFVRARLVPAWRQVAASVRERSARLGLPLRSRLPRRDQRLSPSDFGFHNCLRARGRLHFLDFEYAGWDDPAKTVCDFFCQQAVPAPKRQFAAFAKAVAAGLARPQEQLARMRMLLPVYHLKWCCILLNEFLPVGRERRRFAGGQVRQALQLRKAQTWLESLRTDG